MKTENASIAFITIAKTIPDVEIIITSASSHSLFKIYSNSDLVLGAELGFGSDSVHALAGIYIGKLNKLAFKLNEDERKIGAACAISDMEQSAAKIIDLVGDAQGVIRMIFVAIGLNDNGLIEGQPYEGRSCMPTWMATGLPVKQPGVILPVAKPTVAAPRLWMFPRHVVAMDCQPEYAQCA